MAQEFKNSEFSEIDEETQNKVFNLKDIKAEKGKNTNFPKYGIRVIEDHFEQTANEMIKDT